MILGQQTQHIFIVHLGVGRSQTKYLRHSAASSQNRVWTPSLEPNYIITPNQMVSLQGAKASAENTINTYN